MTKLQRAFAVLIAAVILIFLSTGSLTAFADTAKEPSDGQVTEITCGEDIVAPEEDEEPVTGIDGVAEQFINYLKDKYGADYEFYYNQIIEQWGSIEGYLLAFGNKLPEEYQSGWDKFVGWLNKYAPVWAVPLAVIIIVIIAVVGKKAFNKAIDKIVNKKLNPVVQELNLQSNATVSLMRAQKALLGNSPKFSDTVKELEEAEKGLNNG